MASSISFVVVILMALNVNAFKHCLNADPHGWNQRYRRDNNPRVTGRANSPDSQVDETEECMICSFERRRTPAICTDLKRTVVAPADEFDEDDQYEFCGGNLADLMLYRHNPRGRTRPRFMKCSAATDWNVPPPGPVCDAADSMMEKLTAEDYFNYALLAWDNAPTRAAVIALAGQHVVGGGAHPITSAADYDANGVAPPTVFFDWFWLYNLKQPCHINSRVPGGCAAYDRNTYQRDDQYVDLENDPSGNTRPRSGGNRPPYIHHTGFQQNGQKVEKCVARHNTVQSVHRVDALFGNLREGDNCITGNCPSDACGCYRWDDENDRWNPHPSGGGGYFLYRQDIDRDPNNANKYKCLSRGAALIAQNPPRWANSNAPKNRDGQRFCPPRHQAQEAHVSQDNYFNDDHDVHKDTEIEKTELRWLRNRLKRIRMQKSYE